MKICSELYKYQVDFYDHLPKNPELLQWAANKAMGIAISVANVMLSHAMAIYKTAVVCFLHIQAAFGASVSKELKIQTGERDLAMQFTIRSLFAIYNPDHLKNSSSGSESISVSISASVVSSESTISSSEETPGETPTSSPLPSPRTKGERDEGVSGPAPESAPEKISSSQAISTEESVPGENWEDFDLME